MPSTSVEVLVVAEVVRVARADDRALHAELVRGEGGDHVHLVGLGHPEEEVGAAGPDVAQELRARAVAGHEEHVELALERPDALRISVDQRHVVALEAERPGDVATHLARAHDDDPHARRSLRAPVWVTPY
jgi:hypothetical protein